MIAVTLEGRLGNQLFQYAFIYAASKRLGTSFYLDKSVDNFQLPKYFDIKPDFPALLDNKIFSINGYKNIFNLHAKKAFYSLANKVIFRGKKIIVDSATPAKNTLNTIKNNCLYQGYFQSEDYFIDYKSAVVNLYTIKDKYKIRFENAVASTSIPKNYVAVHVRRGDYLDHGLALTYEYFHKAIASIHTENNYYVFLSDEPGSIEKEFSYIQSSYISYNEEIVDFQLIAHAKTCILSNSSFSWWAAYLNRQNPLVIAPRYWLGQEQKKEFPAGIIPASWTRFDHT